MAPSLGLPIDRERALGPQVREARPGETAVAVAASVVGGSLLVAAQEWVAFALVGMAFVAALGAVRPALFLALFLLVRPLLDEVSDVTVGVRSANVGGALALLLILTTALVAASRRRLTWPAATPALLVALAVTAVSAVYAYVSRGAVLGTQPFSEVVRIAALCAAYVLAANVFGTPRKARRLFLLVGLSALVPAILGLAEWIGGPPIPEGLDVGRISGPFTGPVPFGIFLAVAALIVTFLPWGALRPLPRVALVAVVVTALVGTSSRTGWIVFVGGVLLLGLPRAKVTVLVVAALVAGLLALVPSVHDRVLPAPAATTASAPRADTSWEWRKDNARTLLRKWAEAPVFGYGLRSTAYVNPRAPVATRTEAGGGFAAHSLLVRLLVEGGVILAAAYGVFFVALMHALWRLARDSWELQDLAKLLLVIWGLLLFAGVVAEDPLDATATVIPLLALTGSLDAAHRVHQQAHPPPVK